MGFLGSALLENQVLIASCEVLPNNISSFNFPAVASSLVPSARNLHRLSCSIFPVHGEPFAASLQEETALLLRGWNHCGECRKAKATAPQVTTFSTASAAALSKHEHGAEMRRRRLFAGQSLICRP